MSATPTALNAFMNHVGMPLLWAPVLLPMAAVQVAAYAGLGASCWSLWWISASIPLGGEAS